MLKTRCYQCVFKTEFDCKLGKHTFIEVQPQRDSAKESKSQFTEGFCRHKRYATTSREYSTLDIYDEESKVAVILYCVDMEIESVLTRIKSIDLTQYDQLIIVVRNLQKSNKVKLVDLLKTAGVPWTIDNLTDDEELDPLLVFSYAARLVKVAWIHFAYSDVISIKDLECRLRECGNILGFYIDENNKLDLVIHKRAFDELDGNYQLPWFEKVQTFQNWKDVCEKISE